MKNENITWKSGKTFYHGKLIFMWYSQICIKNEKKSLEKLEIMKYNDITQTKYIEKYFIIVDKLKNCIFDAVIPNVFYQNLGKSHEKYFPDQND